MTAKNVAFIKRLKGLDEMASRKGILTREEQRRAAQRARAVDNLVLVVVGVLAIIGGGTALYWLAMFIDSWL